MKPHSLLVALATGIVTASMAAMPAMASSMQCPAVSQIVHQPGAGSAWTIDAAAQKLGWYIWAGPSIGLLIDSPVTHLPNDTAIFVDIDNYSESTPYASGEVTCNYPVANVADPTGDTHRLILKNVSRMMLSPKFLQQNHFIKTPQAGLECDTHGTGPEQCRWW